MKKNLLLLSILLLSAAGTQAQTATNFTCNDCSGVSHDLFSELNAGKVIVLDWVMPCASCVGPSVTAYNMVQGYQSSHPNQVYFYMADDYANTACPSLNSWANGINILESTWSRRFVNADIDMYDYGSPGMPKIVVLGGVNHTVFYNANNTVNSTAMQNAINLALSSTGIAAPEAVATSLKVQPNPSSEQTTIKFGLSKQMMATIDLYDMKGKKVREVLNTTLAGGEQNIPLDVRKLSKGTYLVHLKAGDRNSFVNLVVTK